MLIHVTPQFYSRYKNLAPLLIRLEIPELGVSLDGHHLATRKPWPNKCVFDGCRRIGQKAVSGLLFDVPFEVTHYTMLAHWQTPGLPGFVVHEVRHEIIDSDFEFLSDEMVFWGRDSSFPARGLGLTGNFTPSQAKPFMSHFDTDHGPVRAKSHGSVTDEVRPGSCHIVHRREVFRQPTLERERLIDTRLHLARFPTLDEALSVSASVA